MIQASYELLHLNVSINNKYLNNIIYNKINKNSNKKILNIIYLYILLHYGNRKDL